MSDDESLAALAAVEAQERHFIFDSFDQNDAWRLGTIAVGIVQERGLALAVQIVLNGHIVFKAALNGVEKGTDDWLAGKAALADHFQSSSLNVRYRKDRDPTVLVGIDEQVMRAHGGSFPIRVKGKGIVGTITASGVTDVEDHEIVAEAVRRALGH
jgi:uncharacterized protein (UPF0303 family)